MKVSILGCGWLGFPLAKQLVALGCQVSGSTTSAEKISILAEADIKPFLLSLPANKATVFPDFFDLTAQLIQIIFFALHLN